MIPAVQLMTGDYAVVAADELCIPKGTIVKVRVVDSEDNLPEYGLKGRASCVSVHDRTCSGGIWCDFLAPIPLTPEILEGSGFSFGNTANEEDCDNPAEKGWCYCDENGEVKVTFPHGTDGGEIYVNNYSFRTLRLVFPDKIYLHELQHALKLGGIELEIKL